MQITRLLLLLFWSLSICFDANASWTGISANEPTKATVRVLSQTATELLLFVRVEGFEQRDININGVNYQLISSLGCSPVMIQGKPDLPKLTLPLIVPPSGISSVEVVSSSYRDFNLEIAPSKGNLYRDQDPDRVPYQFGPEYSRDGYFPVGIINTGSTYVMRDVTGQTLNVFPFSYSHKNKTLRVYYALTLRVKINQGASWLPANPAANMDADFYRIYARHFVNFNAFNYTPLLDQGKMLVICDSALVQAMAPFIAWKNQTGQETKLVSVQQIGQSPSQIKSFVESYYNNFGITFLLIVGDATQVPPFNATSGDSDPSYGYIIGQDSYPEVMVGRFSANNLSELITQVNRTIMYELHPDTTGSSFDKAICIASSQGPGDDNEYDYQHERNIRNDLLGYHYNYADELYDGAQGLADAPGSPTPIDLTNAWNDGRGLITYTGHGSANGFVTTGFGLNDISGLTNTRTLPFIWSVACVNGNFSSGTCFAEGLLRARDSSGKATGAIAALMSTINQSWDPPMDAQDEMVDILVESYPSNIRRTFGGLSENGCMHMNDQYGAAGFEMTDTWTCFGDPSLMVRTATPHALLVSHPAAISAGTFLFTCNVSDEGALVCITLHDSIIATGWVVAGICNLSLSGLADGDSLLLTVTAYNAVPYQSTIYVTSSATGVAGDFHHPEINLYPNPSHGNMLIVFGDINQSGTIAICDIAGRALQMITFNLQTEVRLDVSDYSSGTYFLKIDTGDKIIIRQFFLQ